MKSDKFKVCSYCKKRLPATKNIFHVDSRIISDGLRSRCKNCTKKLNSQAAKNKLINTYTSIKQTCAICETSLPATIEYFYPSKTGKYGLRLECKDCHKQWQRSFAKNNRIKINLYKRKRYSEDSRYRKNHIKSVSDYAKRNPEKVNLRSRNFRINNPKAIKVIQRKSNAKRRKNPMVRLNDNVSCLIRQSLIAGKQGKSVWTHLGFTRIELIKHIESQFEKGMHWGNYGRGGWCIDHIKPRRSFQFDSSDSPQFKECWKLSNLRPCWEKENSSKGAKYKGLDYRYVGFLEQD
ncbi:MAG: hypothetical protein CMH70_02235 [Nitrosomonadaceae bacterium]|nr:hypothetical protein [Nitrosomonadaceae bacterium]|tara:strand:- start:244 stop:1122 length:879 start_codon:yes stop_codon:yes gene_type:complete